jgi:hypothetical protein
MRASHLLLGAPIVALLALAGLLLFTRFVPPTSVQSLVFVLLLLILTLLGLLAPLLYGIRKLLPLTRQDTFNANHSLREALILSIYIVFNALLRVLHSWSLFSALISTAIVVVLEILLSTGF